MAWLAAAALGGIAAHAEEPRWMPTGYGELFDGVDGGALYFAAGEKLTPPCKALLSADFQAALQAQAADKGVAAWRRCHSALLQAALAVVQRAEKEAGGRHLPLLGADHKRWRDAVAGACPQGERLRRLACDIRREQDRIGLLNLWFYEIGRSNPEGIFATEYEWIWDLDPHETPANQVCLTARETVNLRQSPVVKPQGGGAVVGKLAKGERITGIYYLGRQEGPCQLWLYGHAAKGESRGFACLRLPGQVLLQPCREKSP